MADNSGELDSQHWESHFFYVSSRRQMEPVVHGQLTTILAKLNKVQPGIRLESILVKDIDNVQCQKNQDVELLKEKTQHSRTPSRQAVI